MTNGMAEEVSRTVQPRLLPESKSLRLVIAMEIGLAEVPGANGLPPLWKPGIRQFYRSSLEAFRPAYAKAGLRGLQFGDEINTSPLSLLTARTYLDIRRDAEALNAYREWLARRFGRIERFGSPPEQQPLHRSIVWTGWSHCTRLLPGWPARMMLRNKKNPGPEQRPPGVSADTVEQFARGQQAPGGIPPIGSTGHWLAEYAKLAKESIGPVPVLPVPRDCRGRESISGDASLGPS